MRISGFQIFRWIHPCVFLEIWNQDKELYCRRWREKFPSELKRDCIIRTISSWLTKEVFWRVTNHITCTHLLSFVRILWYSPGLSSLMRDNLTEHPETINVIERMNIYQEVVLAVMYRYFIQPQVTLALFYVSDKIIQDWMTVGLDVANLLLRVLGAVSARRAHLCTVCHCLATERLVDGWCCYISFLYRKQVRALHVTFLTKYNMWLSPQYWLDFENLFQNWHNESVNDDSPARVFRSSVSVASSRSSRFPLQTIH